MGDECIRLMQIEDLEAVYAIEQLSFSTPWSFQAFRTELLNNELAHYFCLVAAGEVIGYMGLWNIMDEGHITNIAVSPQYRCRGLGELLVRSVMKYMSKNGMERMTLEVRASNLAARKLYERLGFVTAGIRKAYYSDNREDALIMWTELEKNSVEVNTR